MEHLISLVIAVAADLISHYIRKWLDGERTRRTRSLKRSKPPL